MCSRFRDQQFLVRVALGKFCSAIRFGVGYIDSRCVLSANSSEQRANEVIVSSLSILLARYGSLVGRHTTTYEVHAEKEDGHLMIAIPIAFRCVGVGQRGQKSGR